MNNTNIAITSESVTSGHPDKVADQISDTILDKALEKDVNAKVAIETLVTKQSCVVAGELTINEYLNIEKIVREAVNNIGYKENLIDGFDTNLQILSNIKDQSPEIASGVNKEDQGAGDQGIVFGYACDENYSYFPTIQALANCLAKNIDLARIDKKIDSIFPDGKTQVTYDFANNKINKILISVHHKKEKDLGELKEEIFEKVVKETLNEDLFQNAKIGKLDFNPNITIDDFIFNPLGSFINGGPGTDSGLTGRKIVIDAYGAFERVGGGAFSGKDPSKIDRSAAYMARYIAKNLVAAKLAKKCTVQMGYIIGVADPVSFIVDTYGTGVKSDRELTDNLMKVLDLRPKAIVEKLKLRRPIYKYSGNYSHFGENFDPRIDTDWITWENLDLLDVLSSC